MSGIVVDNDSDGMAAMSGCNMSDRDGSAAKIRLDLEDTGKSKTHRDIKQRGFDLSSSGRTEDVKVECMDDGCKSLFLFLNCQFFAKSPIIFKNIIIIIILY